MTKEPKPQPTPPTAEEVLRRMLNTPPKPHTDMVARKAKPRGKKK